MGKKDSKHRHKKSSHKKKRKKERKKSKGKKNTYESSDSDSSTSTSSYEIEKIKKYETKEDSQTFLRSNDDNDEWSALFSDRNATAKEKKVKARESQIFDKPGQSARELNPYWKDGGNGLPPSKDEAHSQTSKINAQSNIEASRCFEDRNNPENKNEKNKILNFKRPGEMLNKEFINSYSRNWKKKELLTTPEIAKEEALTEENVEHDRVKSEAVLNADDLNALAAQAMKAEIMGNKTLSEQLKKEIEKAKENREKTLKTNSEKIESKKEVVLLTAANSKGFVKPFVVNEDHKSLEKRKKQKLETHKGNDRVRYFIDDDKHSLKTMFEKEKFGTTDQSHEMFLKMAKRGKMRMSSDGDDMDDYFLDRVRGSDFERKEAEGERQRNMKASKEKHKSLSTCRWCLDGNNVEKHLIVSIGTTCYLCLPSSESLTDGHCLIVPVNHETCGTLLDEDTWEEMQLFRKTLCRMFENEGQDVVFFENARSFSRFPHMVLNCVPLEKEACDLAPIYFKKAIQDSETEWSNNKKVVDLREKNLRRSIPKGLPYFAVDFGREGGFAHVIEDEKLFPPTFAEEVICGMLDLNPVKWKKRIKESYDVQKEKTDEFIKKWKKYEFSSVKKRRRSSSSSSSSEN